MSLPAENSGLMNGYFISFWLIPTNIFRLEQLCKERGRKVPLRLKSTVTTFRLDSGYLTDSSASLECHIEVSTQQPNSGDLMQETKYMGIIAMKIFNHHRIFCLLF